MNTRKILGISLMVLLLLLCAVLMILRLGAARASDTAALEASMATPEPTATPDATPEPTATLEPTPTPEPTATPAPTLDPNSPAGRAAALGGLALSQRRFSVKPVAKAENLGFPVVQHIVDHRRETAA